jgi:hypothetical protein
VPVGTIVRLARRGLAGAVVGLCGHAALYRSLWPGDTIHGYLGWYELAVAVLSLAAVVALVAGLAVSLRGRRPAWLALGPQGTYAGCVVELAVSGLVWLYVQETLERSIPHHGLVLAAFAPGQLIGALVGLAAAALVLALLLRAGERIVRSVLGGRAVADGETVAGWSIRPADRRPHRPLAVRSGLRAPPVLSTA